MVKYTSEEIPRVTETRRALIAEEETCVLMLWYLEVGKQDMDLDQITQSRHPTIKEIKQINEALENTK